MMEQVLLLRCGWDNYHLRCTISPGQTQRLTSAQTGRVLCSLMYSRSDLSSAPLGFIYLFISHDSWVQLYAEWRDIEGAAFSTLVPILLQRCPRHLRLRKIHFMQMYPLPHPSSATQQITASALRCHILHCKTLRWIWQTISLHEWISNRLEGIALAFMFLLSKWLKWPW